MKKELIPLIVLLMFGLEGAAVAFSGLWIVIFCSTIMSYGIALIIWIPLLLLLIRFNVYVAKLILGEKNTEIKNRSVDKKILPLIEYIKAAKAENKTDALIKQLLKYNGGWSDEDIKNAFNEYTKEIQK
jgi:hypothetical protein